MLKLLKHNFWELLLSLLNYYRKAYAPTLVLSTGREDNLKYKLAQISVFLIKRPNIIITDILHNLIYCNL